MSATRVLAREPSPPGSLFTAPPTAFVLDASFSAAWFLSDETTPLTAAALQATATAEVWVPALWLLSCPLPPSACTCRCGANPCQCSHSTPWLRNTA